jgi:hypothetical protein
MVVRKSRFIAVSVVELAALAEGNGSAKVTGVRGLRKGGLTMSPNKPLLVACTAVPLRFRGTAALV